MWIKST